MERIVQIVTLAVSIYTVLAQDPIPVVTVTGPNGAVQKGTNVELTCLVENLDLFAHATKWLRVDNSDENLFRELSSHNTLNDQVSPDHFELTSSYNQNTKVSMYKITIKGVKKMDDGFYKCVVRDLDTDTDLASEEVEVLYPQPISSLSLTVGPNRFDSGPGPNVIDLEQFDPDMPIICKVRGSNPAAHVKITIDGENVTPLFGREDDPKADGKTYESVRRFDTDVDSTGSYKLTKDKAGKPIICKAWIEGKEDKALEATAQIKLKAPPVAICDNKTTRLGDRRLAITCTITASPKVTSPIWRVNGPDAMVKVPTTKTEVQGYSASMKDINDTTIEVTLSIDLVEKKHFDTIFYLEATTGAEPVDHAVRIHQSGSTGGQGRVLMPTAVLMSVVMIGGVVKRLL